MKNMTEMFQGAEATIDYELKRLNAHYKGRHVELLRGDYKGRTATIDGVSSCGPSIYMFVKIPKLDGSGFLNDKVDARRGYTVNEVRLLGQVT